MNSSFESGETYETLIKVIREYLDVEDVVANCLASFGAHTHKVNHSFK